MVNRRAAYTAWIHWIKEGFTSPGRTQWDGAIFHHTHQNGMQFKTHELCISGVFHLILSDHSCSQVTKTIDKEGVLYILRRRLRNDLVILCYNTEKNCPSNGGINTRPATVQETLRE